MNKYLYNFIIELALFVQIVLWASLGATIIVPILWWLLLDGEGKYFDIKYHLKKFRNYKIKD